MFLKCAPLSLSQLTTNIQNNSPRIFLGLFSNSAVLGLFAVVYQLFNMSSVAFTSALNFYLKKDDKLSLEQLPNLILICFLLTLAGVSAWFLLGEMFLSLIFGDSYLEVYSIVLLLLCFLFLKFTGLSIQWMIMKTGRFLTLAKHQVAISLISVGVGFVSIFYKGYDGALFSVMFTSVFYAIYMSILLYKEHQNE